MADYQNPKAGNAILDDLQEIVALINSGAKMDPTGNTNIPTGAKRVVAVTGGYQIQSYNGTTWVSVGKLMHDCDSVDGKSPNTGATADTIPVRNNKGQLPGDITGNAATATKLATARTIDLGGIVSATEQEFDGSKPITIPVNSINVNNEQDNALVGEVSKLHGGTGRTDGAAADVMVSSAQGEVKASVYGQIGDAINKTGTDLDTLTVTGKYLFRGGTVEKHFPWDIPEASLTVVEVYRAGVHIFQTLTYSSGQQWMRRSANTGGEWLAWMPVQGQYGQNAHISIYISKSGSDDNTGLDSAYPVLTINRALEVARGIVPSRGTYGVKFCIGEGDWGNVSFESLPFNLRIYPYDGNAPTQYSDSLPTFTGLYVISSDVWVEGIVVNGSLTATRGANVIVQSYNKAAVWQAHYGGALQIDSSTAPIETGAISNQQFVFRSYNGGVLVIAGTRTLSVVENLNLSAGFLSMDRGGAFNGADLITCETAEGITVTGKKYALLRGSCVTCDKSWLDTFPGSQAGTLETGSKIRTGVWGGGDAHTFLAADATWKKDSSYIYARDVAVSGDTDDLASARGQIGQAPSLSATDWNTLTKSGVYWFSNAAIGGSSNTPAKNGGHLVVHATNSYIHQFYYEYGNCCSYMRVASSNNWSAWKQLFDASGNSPNNAATASKLATARDIVLKGQVTGTVSFDGSEDVSMTTYNGAYASARVEGEAQENCWFKIAETTDIAAYAAFNIRFLVQLADTHGPSFVWTISGMLSSDHTRFSTLESRISDVVNGALSEVSTENFVVTSFKDNSGNAHAALWVHIPSRYSGWKFTVLGESSRYHRDNTAWKLYICEKEDGVTEIPSSHTSVPTTIFTSESQFATGDFCWSYASSKTGFLLCNGAAVSRTTYADLYAIIGTKFGTGDGSTTFNLPDMRGKVAWGANGNLGSVLAAGLPNITGNVTLYTQVLSAGGAFAQGSGGNRADGNYGADHVRFDFNASRSNSIYGKSTTVQPPAIALNCFIKY